MKTRGVYIIINKVTEMSSPLFICANNKAAIQELDQMAVGAEEKKMPAAEFCLYKVAEITDVEDDLCPRIVDIGGSQFVYQHDTGV